MGTKYCYIDRVTCHCHWGHRRNGIDTTEYIDNDKYLPRLYFTVDVTVDDYSQKSNLFHFNLKLMFIFVIPEKNSTAFVKFLFFPKFSFNRNWF